MANTKDIKMTHLKVMIWGDAKSGKTTFASTFPRPFFFDLDIGMLTLAGKDIEYESYDGSSRGYEKFRKDLPLIAQRDDIDTIVIDSLSTLHPLMMDSIQKLQGTWPGIPQIKEYGVQVVQMRRFLFELVRYKKHVVLTGHEQIFQDELTKEVFILPLIVGKKMPKQLGLWFDEFYHMEAMSTKEGMDYKIRTRPSRKYNCGTRIGGMKELEEPTFENIMKIAKESGKM
jgi:hypothetical protein